MNCQLLRIEGVAWSAQRIPMAINFGFLDRSRYFSIQVALTSSTGGGRPVGIVHLRTKGHGV
jgi:hypothetical protein